MAASDSVDHAAKDGEVLSGRRRLVKHLQDGDRIFVCDRGVVLSGP